MLSIYTPQLNKRAYSRIKGGTALTGKDQGLADYIKNIRAYRNRFYSGLTVHGRDFRIRAVHAKARVYFRKTREQALIQLLTAVLKGVYSADSSQIFPGLRLKTCASRSLAGKKERSKQADERQLKAFYKFHKGRKSSFHHCNKRNLYVL